MRKKRSTAGSPIATFEDEFQGKRVQFQVLAADKTRCHVLVYQDIHNKRNQPPVDIVISLGDKIVRVNGERIADFILCKERSKTSRGRRRSRSGKRSAEKFSAPHKTKLSVIQVEKEKDDTVTMQSTWFDYLKSTMMHVGKAGKVGMYSLGWLAWVVTHILSFLYYDIIDFGPLSLPIVGFIVSFVYPETSRFVEEAGIFVLSLMGKPMLTISRVIQSMILGTSLLDVGQLVKNGTVLYDSPFHQIIAKT